VRRTLRLTGITPDIVEEWAANGVFPVPGTTAETVERWLSGSERIPDVAGKFLLERKTELLEKAKEVCRWFVADMHRVHGGYYRSYRVCQLIYDDASMYAKYEDEREEWMSFSMHGAYWRHLAMLLGTEGIETQLVPFVESEYLAHLAERGEEHSADQLDRWMQAKADIMHFAGQVAKKLVAKIREIRDVPRREGPDEESAPPTDRRD
jgi:hypothetical protein